MKYYTGLWNWKDSLNKSLCPDNEKSLSPEHW